MNPALVADISSAACWDSDVVLALDCVVEGDAGLLILTEFSFYLLKSEGDSDAKILLEDLREGICQQEHAATATGVQVRLQTIDDAVSFVVSATGADALRSFFPDVPDVIPFDCWNPPPPGVLQMSQGTQLEHDAMQLKDAVRREQTLLRSMLDLTRPSSASSAAGAELPESDVRINIICEQHLEFLGIWTQLQSSWHKLVNAQFAAALADVKNLHTSTHRLDLILPDAGLHSGMSEIPLSNSVSLLLENLEKTARTNMDTFLTTRHISARNRRAKLEAEMAIRELKSDSAATLRNSREISGQLAASEAKCRDLEASCSAMATQLSDMQQRESVVLQRAQRREEELFAQLQRAPPAARSGQFGSTTFDFLAP